jgi:WS/DGAT/MGAT family acyltransferase
MRDALAYETQRQMATAGDLAASILSAGRDAARDPVGVARRGLRMASSTARLLRPATAPLSPVMTDRSLSVDYQTLTVDLPRLKSAARTVAGKLNDAFVAGVAGGLRRYHEHHGAPVEHLRMTMPINVRDGRSAAAAGNHFVPARFAVPVGLEDPLALMTAVQRVVDDERAEPALSLSEPIAGVLNRLPTTATTALFGAMLKGIDFVSSNVPGAPFPLYIAGAKVEAQFAFGPMTGSAANITLLSYLDDLNIGVNLDPAAIPDADVFMANLRESFDEITKLG